MTVYCNAMDCEYNESGECNRDYIDIRETLSTTYPAVCSDYCEREEDD